MDLVQIWAKCIYFFVYILLQRVYMISAYAIKKNSIKQGSR